MKDKIIVIGNNIEAKSEIYTYLASAGDEVIVVDDIEKARELLLKIPPINPPLVKPFIITAPPIAERTFKSYQTGQERRRERRKKQRK